MPPARVSDLEFYALLRDHDSKRPETTSALAFARLCRDLLTRIATAWAVQHSLDALPLTDVPSLSELFLLALGNDKGLSSPRGALTALLSDCARWLLLDFNPADPFDSSYQVWVGKPGASRIQLEGARRSQAAPEGIQHGTSAGSQLAAELAEGSVSCIGHYDVHGLASLAISLRALRGQGVDEARGIFGFEQTGDIGKLWKRTLPQALRLGEDGRSVLMIDCPVHSRTPEHTLKALRILDSHAGARLVIVDHHADTISLAPMLHGRGLQLILTDVLGCALLGDDDHTTRQLRLLGALGDKVPEVTTALPVTEHAALYAANEIFNATLLHFSPTPKAFKSADLQPCEPLWEALANGEAVSPELARLVVDPVKLQPALDALPACLACGSLLFVTDRLTVLGRSWYGLLEKLMDRSGLSYAVALRLLDGNRANMLLLTHWQHSHMPPIRSFIPDSYLPRTLGHPAAVWIDLDKSAALGFLNELTINANAFFDTAADFSQVAALLHQNILDAPASVLANPSAD